MNCKEAQLLIAGLTGDALPETLAAHIGSCAACAELLAVDARLRATLRSVPPVPSPYVLGRIRQEIAASQTLPLGGGQGGGRKGFLNRNTLMKITLPATALLAVALVATLPHSAEAATPAATFAKMRKAVLAQAKSMTSLDVKVGKTPDGAVGAWVVIDGELTQLAPNGSFHANKDGKDITVTTTMSSEGSAHVGKKDTVTTSSEISKLPPAQRAGVEKAIRDAMSGKGGANVTTTYTINGQSVDEATAKKTLHDHGVDLSLHIDLDADDYRSIAFGADHDHLVLTPKKVKDRRTVVALDPKTGLPKNVLLQKAQAGRWVALRSSAVTLR